jgi:hypothetical protein
MWFVDGLKEEIKSVVMIQRSANLDSTCALALVQEEACDSGKKKDNRHFDSFHRSASRSVVFLSEPPKFDKPLGSSGCDERRSSEFIRTKLADDKLKALKQYRRARGLCDRCAEKWSYGHKCASMVQLHVMQELWELMSEDDGLSDAPSVIDSAEQSQLCLMLSEAASTCVESPKSMKFMGHIHGLDIVILLDSGSSHTFMSSSIATQLSGLSSLSRPLSIKVASGINVVCDSQLL